MAANKLIFQSADKAKAAITDAAKKDIAKLYSDWADEIGKKAEYYKTKTTASSWLQEQNMRQLQAQLTATSKQISNEVYGIAKDSIYKVSDAVVQANNKWLIDLGFPVDGVNSAFVSVPDQIVRRLITGQIYESGWSLSKSIWSDNEKTLKDIYGIVGKGLAQNMSAYDISKLLETYVNPDRAKQWNLTMPDGVRIYKKSVDYNAQRLVRTLTQHGYQQSFIATTQDNPFVKDYIWRANGSRACMLCISRNGKHYKKNELPMDHPNGMCTMEPNIDNDKMIDDLANWVNSPDGTYPEIDKFAKKLGYEPGKPETKPRAPRATRTIRKPKQNTSTTSKQAQVIDKTWIEEKAFPQKAIKGWRLGKEGRDNLINVINQDTIPNEYKKSFGEAISKIKKFTSRKDGSYYNSTDKLINVSPRSIEIKKKMSNSYNTIFHEVGHAIDNLAPGNNWYSLMDEYDFQGDMVKDLLKLNKKLKNNGPEISRLNSLFRENDNTQGIQDVVSATKFFANTKYKGITGKKDADNLKELTSLVSRNNLRTYWGHKDEYWLSRDAVGQSAKELFAHMSAATVSETEAKIMEEFFPTAFAKFKTIINDIGSKL